MRSPEPAPEHAATLFKMAARTGMRTGVRASMHACRLTAGVVPRCVPRVSFAAASLQRGVMATGAASGSCAARRRWPVHRYAAVSVSAAAASADRATAGVEAAAVAAACPPVRLAAVPGKGRGMLATRNIGAGDVLLRCWPLAMVAKPLPPAPSGGAAVSCSQAELVSELQRLAWGPGQVRALHALYRGNVGGDQDTALELSLLCDPWPYAPDAAIASSRHQAPPYALAERGDGHSQQVHGPPGNSGSTEGTAVHGSSNASGTSRRAASRGAADRPARTAAAVDSRNNSRRRKSATSATTPGGSSDNGGAAGLTFSDLAAAVRYNATGLPCDDVLSARLDARRRGQQQARHQSYVGLWPAHAMINTSCAPNAVVVVTGRCLTVRACAPIAEGEEVCHSYAGALGLGPLALRRALLERHHGFVCCCPRCITEEQLLPPELVQLYDDITAVVSQQLAPRLAQVGAALAAAGSGGGGGGGAAAAMAAAVPVLQDLLAQLARCRELVEGTLGQVPGATPQARLWLQASMYPLYETSARCAQLLYEASAAATTPVAAAVAPASGQCSSSGAGVSLDPGGVAGPDLHPAPSPGAEFLQLLSSCLRLQGAANAGSDMHVQLSARYLVVCSQVEGLGSRAAEDAHQQLDRALLARYGPADEDAGGVAGLKELALWLLPQQRR